MEDNNENDSVKDAEELLQLFSQLKQLFIEEVKEKEKFRQKLEFNENNTEWSKTYVNHLRHQLNEYKICIESQQNSLNQINQIKETNNELNEKICELKAKLKSNEESNQEFVETIKSEMTSEIEDLKKALNNKEKAFQELNLTISSKDILLNQSKRELNDRKSKSDENIQEIKEFYENKIKCIYKEFDDKYHNIQKQNDEKIIEIRANCMRSIDKTKEEFETKLCKSEIESRDLKEKYSHLRLEFEAMKMSNKFENPKTNSKNYKTSASKPKSANQSIPQTKPKLKIQILDSDEERELIESFDETPNQSVSKRKKLIQSNDSYLDYVKND